MIGPSQSIICRFTSTGQGAAAWITSFSVERSWAVRSASGNFSRRMNMVGTTCVIMIWYFSIAARKPAGSNFSITTTVPPMRCTAVE